MDQAAVWLGSSILVMLGIIVIAIGILVINNLMATYWKPVSWFKYEYRPVYYDPKTGEQVIDDPTITEESIKK